MKRLLAPLCLIAHLAGCGSSESATDGGQAGATADRPGNAVGGNTGIGGSGQAGSGGKVQGANRCTIVASGSGEDGETSRGAEGTYNEASALYFGSSAGSRVLCKTQVATMLWYFRGDIGADLPLTVSEPDGSFTNASVSYRGTLNKTWACTVSAPPAPEIGTISLTIDSATLQPGVPGNSTGTGSAYLIHGMAHAECPPGGASPGEGTVMLDMTF